MRFLPALLLASAALSLSSVPAFAAQCPKPEQDGQRATASGRISALRQNASQMYVEIRGCDDLLVVMRKTPGCKVGRTVTATGRFLDCDYFEFGEVCWNGVLENAKGSCK